MGLALRKGSEKTSPKEARWYGKGQAGGRAVSSHEPLKGAPFIQAGTCGPSLRPYEALFLRKTYAGAKERAFL